MLEETKVDSGRFHIHDDTKDLPNYNSEIDMKSNPNIITEHGQFASEIMVS